MEQIKILAKFNFNKVEIIAFNCADKVYKISHTNFIHHFKEGDQIIFIFHVSDNINNYKLRFEAETLNWFLLEN